MSEQPKNKEFAALFKKFRLRSEIESLSEFGDLFADEGMIYETSLFTRWQNGERVPRDRRVALKMIRLFVKRGGINSADEANMILESLDLRDLSNEEIEEIQKMFMFKPFTKQINNKNGVLYHVQYSYNWLVLVLSVYSKRKEYILTIFIFIIFTIYWLLQKNYRYVGDFASTYFIVALIGGINGLLIANKYGGKKSLIGRSIIMFSCGLLSQVFGQVVYSYYYYNNYILAYPSIGDVGFFGTIPFYIYGVIFLARALGIKIAFRSYNGAFSAAIIPLFLLVFTYLHLLRDYNFSKVNIVTIVFDFSYPLGQSLYISFAILALSLTQGIFGEIKSRIIFLIITLFFQYLSDYTFIYLAHEGLIQAGGFNDYMYLISYFLMALAILQFAHLPHNLKLKKMI